MTNQEKADLSPGEARPAAATEPHRFAALRFADRLYPNGRCAHCYAPKWAHPVHAWVLARPVDDHSPAELSFESLHAEGAPAENVVRPPRRTRRSRRAWRERWRNFTDDEVEAIYTVFVEVDARHNFAKWSMEPERTLLIEVTREAKRRGVAGDE